MTTIQTTIKQFPRVFVFLNLFLNKWTFIVVLLGSLFNCLLFLRPFPFVHQSCWGNIPPYYLIFGFVFINQKDFLYMFPLTY